MFVSRVVPNSRLRRLIHSLPFLYLIAECSPMMIGELPGKHTKVLATLTLVTESRGTTMCGRRWLLHSLSRRSRFRSIGSFPFSLISQTQNSKLEKEKKRKKKVTFQQSSRRECKFPKYIHHTVRIELCRTTGVWFRGRKDSET